MIPAVFALPFELIVTIARADPEIWYQLYRFAPVFTRFATLPEGRAEYIRAFTVIKVSPEKTETYLFGKLNSIYDRPAVIFANGDQEWYCQGKLHRENGPAIIDADGSQYWYYQDQLHQDNGPAVIWLDGDQEWWRQGQRWYQNGQIIK